MATDFDESLTTLTAEGPRFAAAIAAAGLDAGVPTCPGWTARDLTVHLAGIHWWATLIVATPFLDRPSGGARSAAPQPPDDDQLIEWYLDAHTTMVHAIENASPDLECWTILPGSSSRSSWARRQAHETAVHRVDAELAGGVEVERFQPSFAGDGIDELLTGFLLRSGRPPRLDPPLTIGVQCTDTDRAWTVAFEPEGVKTDREAVGRPTRVGGSAHDLYLGLWRRLPISELEIEGDASEVEDFLDRARIG
jgi:uncharacterized protein (TIGR03083 family)